MKPGDQQPPRESPEQVIGVTKRWVDSVVIGLNLCPFARTVQAKGQIRYTVSTTENTDALLAELEAEMLKLSQADPSVLDTTLLIHPQVLLRFVDFNDFLTHADALLTVLSLDGVLQVASFHPDYCFAGLDQADAANYTNRSPYPMLHLLREASISHALDTFPDAARIYQRNIETLRALEPSTLERLVNGKER